ncbi:iron chaperone [Paenibacillus sp. strain BS8-2]
MEEFAPFLDKIDNTTHRERLEEVFAWILESFPTLRCKLAWNQPMFTDHETFIIGFSAAQKHMSVAPEKITMSQFSEEIAQSGYDATKELIRIPWKEELDYELLRKLIQFNIEDKADCTTFWRK